MAAASELGVKEREASTVPTAPGQATCYASYGLIPQSEEWPMAKEKDDKARAEGLKRGLDGKRDAAGVTQGWTDDKSSGIARSEGWVTGKRKRSRIEAEATKKKS